jgi:regulator of sigma E protease
MFSSLLPFLFVLGVLVFVHELGHFLLARWHGVRVLTFSLGFGPKLLKWRRGDTEYCISAIPLGGYVKMAGDVADSDANILGKPDEFMSKSKWQRFQIFVAGPAMNVLLALVVMTFVLYQGAMEPLYLQRAPTVGAVIAGTAAAKAGIQPGDTVLSVAGKTLSTWEQMDMEVLPRAGQEVDVVIRRNGQEQTLRVTPDARTKFKAGDMGIVPVLHPQVMAVTPGDVAEKAGLKAGDAIYAVDGDSLNSEALIKKLGASAGKPLTFTIARGDQKLDVPVTPGKKGDIGWIGVSLSFAEVHRIEPTFWQAAKMSVDKNIEGSTLIFKTLGGLLNGATSRAQLAGPIGIAQLSSDAAQAGWMALFTLMSMLSLNLGILNLLPIPMLDGGHIFIMALEGAARRDFSVRVKEKLLMAGFLVIMLLMVTVIYNDLTRIEWVEKLMPWR